ncbi:ScbA/BarX family gamma-butyrolactone biosynthesis protein [Streptomyces sp. NPDC057362]|uniref:ScbA/BarX family gamma-butyrolactone biosynthesis protein n=1 Tax=Streptomyces sp. NPDC057362 TaxID=3346106 RepID=UPI00363F1427
MTVSVQLDAEDRVVPALTFERTVARHLVHRRALSEVFLTDSQVFDGSSFVAGAQLPSSHAYFTDHSTPHAVDPLLLLECCRQAETHAVHAHFGADPTTKFVLESWDAELPGLTRIPPSRGPADLVIEAQTSRSHRAGEVLRAMDYRMHLSLSGSPLGKVTMRVKYVSEGVYRALRRRPDGVLPTSDDYRGALDQSGLVDPRRVGRRRAENVVLLEPTVAGRDVRARLRVAGGHPSLFDHAQDHLPGMVLMEAGRQAALLAAEELDQVRADQLTVIRFSASFHAYSELDRPVTVVARRPEDEKVRSGDTIDVLVTFEQAGRTVAETVYGAVRHDA